MAICIRRRQFIGFIGGAAIGWPYVAAGQQSGSVRLIGVLMGGYVPADPDGQKYLAAFLKALQELGWTEHRNVRIERLRKGGHGRSTGRACRRCRICPTAARKTLPYFIFIRKLTCLLLCRRVGVLHAKEIILKRRVGAASHTLCESWAR